MLADCLRCAGRWTLDATSEARSSSRGRGPPEGSSGRLRRPFAPFSARLRAGRECLLPLSRAPSRTGLYAIHRALRIEPRRNWWARGHVLGEPGRLQSPESSVLVWLGWVWFWSPLVRFPFVCLVRILVRLGGPPDPSSSLTRVEKKEVELAERRAGPQQADSSRERTDSMVLPLSSQELC